MRGWIVGRAAAISRELGIDEGLFFAAKHTRLSGSVTVGRSNSIPPLLRQMGYQVIAIVADGGFPRRLYASANSGSDVSSQRLSTTNRRWD
jgi:hypothetical protein